VQITANIASVAEEQEVATVVIEVNGEYYAGVAWTKADALALAKESYLDEWSKVRDSALTSLKVSV